MAHRWVIAVAVKPGSACAQKSGAAQCTGLEMAYQHLRSHGFCDPEAVYCSSSRRLLKAIGFVVADSNLLEAHSTLHGAEQTVSTPIPPLPHNCIAQCAQNADEAASADVLKPVHIQPGDTSGWQAVQRAADVVQALQCKSSLLQRQLQASCACNAALSVSLAEAAQAASQRTPALTPYEAATVCRSAAYEAHMQDADAVHVELLKRQQVAVHAQRFCDWLVALDAADDRSPGQPAVQHPNASKSREPGSARLLAPHSSLHASPAELDEVCTHPIGI